MTPQQFVQKWRGVTLKESSAAQEHFIDICRLVNHPTPAELDPIGERFCFEKGTSKQSGGEGWADVWYKRHFGWEYKGKHADLDKAYHQLLQYREALENPWLLIVSDIDSIKIHTNFHNTVKRIYDLDLDDLLDPRKLEILRLAFHDPEKLKAPVSSEQVTEAAAQEFANLAELLRKYGEDSEEVAHFLIRLLFCLFAEDIGLLPRDIFTKLVAKTRRNSAAFAAQLQQLFQSMATGGWFGYDEIAHFDGGLFDNDTVLVLDSDGIDILVGVSGLDWSSIEPSIIGTLFERSLDPEKRAQLGAHYTGKEEILLIVEPVLMAPLRRRWAEVQEQAHARAAKMVAAKGGAKTQHRQRLTKLLTGFAQEIADIRVLDPACGSGNFLYVALRQMLDLEKEVGTLASELGLPRPFPLVSPAQLYGIEINAYAHELAQATVWIGYIQWLYENGYGRPSEPILKKLDNIKRMDAILAYDEDGRPIEPQWPQTDAIIGNPPFLGANKIRNELGDAYVEPLFRCYDGRVPAISDLVCYWFERARREIELGEATRVGLLATQGIRGGANRVVLERIKKSGDIFWAESDRAWVIEGAAVRVSMIAFDAGVEKTRVLDGQVTDNINPNLSGQTDLTTAMSLAENQGIAFRGNQKGGPFDIDADIATEMLQSSSNPFGRSNGEVVKRWMNGLDITRRDRGAWLIDFGTSMLLEEASQYELPFEYVKEKVYPVRKNNRRKAYREKWWIHAEARPSMRIAISDLDRFIVTPHVSKHRLFNYLLKGIVPDHQLIVVARRDDYFLGVLHSRLHELWSLRQGTALEDRPRYTPTTTFETFPFPWSPGQEPADDQLVEAIAQAARELVVKRDAWLNPPGLSEKELKKRTLTNLYNARPTWLDLAHQKLDHAVLDAYGWPHDLADDEILEHLLALNLKRAAAKQ